MALLGEDAAETPAERDVSLRLLRHLAFSARHEQYHDTEFMTVRVDTPARASPVGLTQRGAGQSRNRLSPTTVTPLSPGAKAAPLLFSPTTLAWTRTRWGRRR